MIWLRILGIIAVCGAADTPRPACMRYYLHVHGKLAGPYPPGEVSALFGRLSPESLACTEFEYDCGKPQWRKISAIAELAPRADQEASDPVPRQLLQSVRKKTLRVLSTDDDPNIRALLWNMLGEAGHNVEFARDGEEVFLRLREKDYDLLILDVNMPKVNGYKVSEILHEKLTSPPKVLIFTGRDLKDEKLHFFCSGADAILNKGTGNDKLLETIDALFSEEPVRDAPRPDPGVPGCLPALVETIQESAGITAPAPASGLSVVVSRVLSDSATSATVAPVSFPEDRGFAGAQQGGEELKKELLRLRRQLGHMELGYAQLEDRLFRQGKENAAANMEYFEKQLAEIRSLRSYLSVALLLCLLGLVVAAFVQGG